jgi:DNA replication initiation complex subunit (GINS family)
MSHSRQDAEKLEKLKRRLAIVERQIEQLRQDASPDDPELVTEHADMLRQQVRDPQVPMDFRTRAEDTLKSIEREIYIRRVGSMLEEAIEAARDGDEPAKGQILTKARSYFAFAMRLGAGEEFKESVRKKIDIIVATTASGTSERAKKSNVQAADLKEIAHEQRLRKFMRFRDPQLAVTINQLVYFTEDWSLGGLLLKDFEQELFPETPLLVQIQVADDGDFKLRCPARVVSTGGSKRHLALKFDAGMSALLPLMDRCRKLGITPTD